MPIYIFTKVQATVVRNIFVPFATLATLIGFVENSHFHSPFLLMYSAMRLTVSICVITLGLLRVILHDGCSPLQEQRNTNGVKRAVISSASC